MWTLIYWLAAFAAFLFVASGKLLGAALILFLINSPRIYRAVRGV